MKNPADINQNREQEAELKYTRKNTFKMQLKKRNWIKSRAWNEYESN